jgi:hypothetical protein
MSPLTAAEKQRAYRTRLRAVRDGDLDPVASLSRAVLATVQHARDNRTPVVELARRNWPDDPAPNIILRAPSQAASVATPAWAGV